MAKVYKNPSLVSGMSVNDILNMDIDTFNKLGVSDMRKVVGRLVSAGNKRIRNFSKSGETSPAYRQVMKSGGLFSTKGKDLNALRSEYTRAKNFMQNRTSTKSGWKKVKKETAEQMKKQGVDVTPDELEDVLKIYERLKEIDPSISSRSLKYRVMQEISTMSDKIDFEEKILAMQDRLEEIYEEQAGLEDEFSGVSDFFEM